MAKTWLHYHPDGIVYIRDANDAPIYEASFDNFRADYGQPFPSLPNGMAQLELYAGRVYLYDAKHNERDAAGVDKAPYIAVLDALPRLVEARKAREDASKIWRVDPSMPTIPIIRP